MAQSGSRLLLLQRLRLLQRAQPQLMLTVRQFSRSAVAAKIYTRTGDKGTSALFTGERRAKDDAVFEALGSTDELSSFIGFAREFSSEKHGALPAQLTEIQCILQEIGSNIATPRKSAPSAKLEKTTVRDVVAQLEEWIDEMDTKLPPLKNFILPSGGRFASSLHCARSVCRRAERRVAPLKDDVDEVVLRFMNRLSDYLFTAARFASLCDSQPEQVYQANRKTLTSTAK
eukprot:m.187563 g.187563  ORF g.187563 m.187563 type:complete len:230 (-) comp17524_c0_seq1:2771-3460(-)